VLEYNLLNPEFPPTMKAVKAVVLTTRITEAQHAKLVKIINRQEDKNIADVLRDLIADYIAFHNKSN
jgi:hypothetical protein